MNIKIYFIITNIYVIDKLAKFVLESKPSYELIIQKSMTTSTSFYTFQLSPNYTAHVSMGRDSYWKTLGLEVRLYKHIHIHKGI